MTKVTDEEIVKQVLAGDTNAFALLVDKYQNQIYHYLLQMVRNHEDAVDCTQDTFVAAYQALHRFRQEASFKNWLYRIAANTARELLRKHQIRRSKFWSNLVPDYQSQQTHPSPEEQAIRDERQQVVTQALEQLTPKYREVIVLYHINGLSYDQISEVLKLPKRTVETRLYRARRKLKEALSKGGLNNEVSLGTQSSAELPR